MGLLPRLHLVARLARLPVVVGGAAAVAVTMVAPPGAQARPSTDKEFASLQKDLEEVTILVATAEKVAAATAVATEAELAKRLVGGQLRLAEGDYEGAAIVFLDLIENHRASQAGPQAVYYLGDALKRMGLVRWSAEQFSTNLADRRIEARRYHQRSVARLLELAAPPRPEGFAREPGMSATPEARARLQAMGLDTSSPPPRGALGARDAAALEQWVESFPAAQRSDELTYAYGRYLFLQGRYGRARQHLDTLLPTEAGFENRPKGKGHDFAIQAAYVAGAASLAAGDIDDAIDRYGKLTTARPRNPHESQIHTLAWMALGRIAHDREEWDVAIGYYRQVSRDSPFFTEALYETAWTLLRADRFDRAIQALDLLLVYQPDSSLRSEIKQLQGKIKIQQADYADAENTFLALRREFSELATHLGKKMAAERDASTYFASVVGEDLEHFSVDEIVPVSAVPFVERLPAARAVGTITGTLGEAERMLFETRALLAKMEEAVETPDKARLFTELGAQAASLDTVDDKLVEIQERLVVPSRRETRRGRVGALEGTRRRLRAVYDEPLGRQGLDRGRVVESVRELEKRAHKQGLVLAALRAQLVATEQYFERTRSEQRIDHKAFLRQAGELRDEIAILEADLAALRAKIDRVEGSLRYQDPWRDARERAVVAYRAHLAAMWGAATRDARSGQLWARTKQLEQRVVKARAALNQTAAARLRYAVRVLQEERVNLDAYVAQARAQHGSVTNTAGQVLAAAYRDVVAELTNLVIRSEVGLLDVAWALKEAEVEAVRRLERDRERDLAEIDGAVDMGLEELER